MTGHAETAAPLPGAVLVRDARDDDMAAVQAIYGHHVLEGLGSFEETPRPTAASPATPMPGRSGRAPPIATRSRIPSMSRRSSGGAASAARCSSS